VDEILIKIAEHSVVVAILIGLFCFILFLLLKLSESRFKEIDKKVDVEIAKVNSDIDTMKDKLHSLGNVANNNMVKSTSIEHKIDLILVKLGSDPIKMAQEN
jgi:hypothetical protein